MTDKNGEKLWKVTYSMEPTKMQQQTLYVEARLFTEAVAYALSAIKERLPLVHDSHGIMERWEDCTAFLVEQVEDLVVPKRTVEIRHHDEVRL